MFFSADVSHAWDQQFSTSGSCDKKATSGGCIISVYAGGGQAYRISGNAHAEGHGGFGGSGGVISLNVCLSRSWAMWDGSCWNIVNNLKIGDGRIDVSWDRSIGDDPNPNFFVGLADFYANDATWDPINVNVNGRRVEVTSMNAPSSVNFGQNIQVSWGTDSSWETYLFTDEGVPPGNSQFVEENGSRNFTANTCFNCTAYFTIRACGPSGGGWTCNFEDRTTLITQAAPGNFNLNVNGCVGGSNRFDLNWSNSANATNYDVYARAWSTGSWNYRGSTGGTSMTLFEAWDTDWYFKVIATNGAGSTESNTVFGGNCPGTPSVDISADSTTVAWNTGTTLRWSSSDASSCSASGDWSGGKPLSGSEGTGNLTSSKTYTLTCTNSNSGLSANDSVTVNVSVPPAPTVDLKCDSSDSCGSVSYGSSKTLSWTVSGVVDSCTASNAWSGSKSPSGGSESTGAITSDRTWTLQCSGPGGTGPADSVSATVPAPSADIRCDNSNGPCNLPWNGSSLIEWCGSGASTCANAASCSVTKNGSGWASGTSGAQSTGNITSPGTYTFTLTCSGNGTTQDSVNVVVANPVPSASNVTVTQPDYCVSGPAATVSWTYSDPSGSPQSAYQVQIDDQGSFNSPEVDSGKVNSGSTSFFSGQGLLDFNTTYRARVRVWNGFDQASDWTTSGSFKTPPYAYPQVNFTWTANGISENPSPPIGTDVQFTDQTVFNGPVNNRQWSWLFGDGDSSTSQNPSHAYTAEGTYYVTLTATDNAGQSCSRTRGPLLIQKPIPVWKEVAPQ